MKRPCKLKSLILTTFFGLMAGLMTCLTACKKERAFVGIWRAEVAREQTTDIHHVFIFGDLTCSWQDSILNLTDSSWTLGHMDGTAILEGDEVLNASFAKKVPLADTERDTTLFFQYTFHKADHRQLYCEALDIHFVRTRRLR